MNAKKRNSRIPASPNDETTLLHMLYYITEKTGLQPVGRLISVAMGCFSVRKPAVPPRGGTLRQPGAEAERRGGKTRPATGVLTGCEHRAS